MLGRWYSMGKDLAFYLFILSPILLQLLAVLLVDSLGHLKKKNRASNYLKIMPMFGFSIHLTSSSCCIRSLGFQVTGDSLGAQQFSTLLNINRNVVHISLLGVVFARDYGSAHR